MSLGKIFDIAGSGMTAQSLRLNVIASNLSNKDSIGKTEKETYHARQPVFETVMEEAKDAFGPKSLVGKVKVSDIQQSQEALRKEFKPGHPFADENGFVFMPNVNPIEEMANMVKFQHAYDAAARVITVMDEALDTVILGMGRVGL